VSPSMVKTFTLACYDILLCTSSSESPLGSLCIEGCTVMLANRIKYRQVPHTRLSARATVSPLQTMNSRSLKNHRPLETGQSGMDSCNKEELY
jgi:hypothetical protein